MREQSIIHLNQVFDELVAGLETDIITTVYGPSGSGKSNLCLISAVQMAASKKVIYVDTEGGFSVERVKQLTPEFRQILDKIILLKPTNFIEQRKAVQLIPSIIAEHRTEPSDHNDATMIGLIIVDTISMLYRLELGTQEEIYEINKSLGRQIGLLSEIARKNKIPILVTNQVYADFENLGNVHMVGGDLLKYGSKCLVELRRAKNGLRSATIRKHRSMPEGKELLFRIVQDGVEIVEGGRISESSTA